MKRKRLFSTAVAGMLVAAQMCMPVMAAGTAGSGSVTSNVTTRNVVVRLVVPTTLAVAVNQYEKNDMGTQISSDVFKMQNKSEIPVKVTVESVATSTVDLVATKAAAEASSNTSGEAWLAVVAQVADGQYLTDTTKGIKDLTETDKNVVTFDTTNKKASQTFYLAGPSDNNITYKGYVPKEDDKADVSFASFYKLTELTDVNSQSTLDSKLGTSAVYEATVPTGTTNFSVNNVAIRLTGAQGGTGTYATGKKYYTVADTATANNAVKTNESYMYSEASLGGAAAFRYIGKLGAGKTGAWTSTQISKVVISYEIDHMSQADFNETKAACVYGLYTTMLGTTAAGASVMNTLEAPTAISLKGGIVTRLKNTAEGTNTVQFALNPKQLATFKTESTAISVQKITVKSGSTTIDLAVTTDFTGEENTNAPANTDGKMYKLNSTGVGKLSVSSIDSMTVEYASAASGVPVMKVTYTFQ